MDLPDRLASLAASPLVTGWGETSSDDRFDLLDAEAIASAAGWSGLEPAWIPDVVDAARRIHDDDSFARLFHHVRDGLLIRQGLFDHRSTFPNVIEPLAELSGPFYLLIAMSGVDPMRASHRAHGIPDTVSRLTARDIRVWIDEHLSRGVPCDTGFRRPFDPMPVGIHARGLAWISRSLIGQIIRVERLQFIHAPFRPPFTIRRHRETGDIAVFAEGGLAFDEAGWRCDQDEKGVTQSPDPSSGQATRIADNGHAIANPTEIVESDWEILVAPGDPILEIHIPEDGPMDFAECGASFRQAIEHYTTWYPDRPFKAFSCGSWLLDPQFQDYLAESSNLVRFQRASRLFPHTKGPGRSGLLRIFESDDLPNLPRDTSMRRAYLDHLESGGGWYGGGCVVLPSELDRWP